MRTLTWKQRKITCFSLLRKKVIFQSRLHGHMAPTYESASTRLFRLGRTDTIRSASLAAKAFCEAMQSAKMKVSAFSVFWLEMSSGFARVLEGFGN